MKHVAAGFSDHSGWAVMAVVRQEAGGPFELDWRARIQTCPPNLPRQPFHAVAEQGFDQEVIAEVYGAAVGLGRRAIEVARLESKGSLSAAAVAIGRLGRADSRPETAATLKSHAMLHSAEGELYRDALTQAAAEEGLRIVRFISKEVRSEAAAALGCSLAQLETRLDEIGKAAGRPWTKDEKDATAASMLALATVPSR
ncbi:MAG: hypothetical protein ABI577_06910 [bacterium]